MAGGNLMMFEARTGASPRQGNRKSINRRRKKSQHLLDVHIRSDKARSQRNQRIVLFFSKIFLVIGVIAGLAYGVRYGLNRVFFANPNYLVSHITVDNAGTLDRDTIVKASGIRSGVNIFSLSLETARKALLQIPQIEDAQVSRSLPDTVKIVITERHPVAWLAATREKAESLDHSQALLIDASGVVLKAKSVLAEYLRLPIIVGVPVDNLRIGQPITVPEVRTALALIQKSANVLAGRFDVLWVDLSSGYSFEVRDRENTRVRLGPEDLDGQLVKLRLLLDYCDTNHKKMATANLMVQRNVPVTFVRIETAEPVAEKVVPSTSNIRVRKAIPVSPVKNKKSTNGQG